eukprot:2820161-Amphidinium_carterae.2
MFKHSVLSLLMYELAHVAFAFGVAYWIAWLGCGSAATTVYSPRHSSTAAMGTLAKANVRKGSILQSSGA